MNFAKNQSLNIFIASSIILLKGIKDYIMTDKNAPLR